LPRHKVNLHFFFAVKNFPLWTKIYFVFFHFNVDFPEIGFGFFPRLYDGACKKKIEKVFFLRNFFLLICYWTLLNIKKSGLNLPWISINISISFSIFHSFSEKFLFIDYFRVVYFLWSMNCSCLFYAWWKAEH
jgi:hypothetical protein